MLGPNYEIISAFIQNSDELGAPESAEFAFWEANSRRRCYGTS